MSNRSNHRCGCGGRHHRGCLNSVCGWYHGPYYTLGCPDVDGEYEYGCKRRCKRRCDEEESDSNNCNCNCTCTCTCSCDNDEDDNACDNDRECECRCHRRHHRRCRCMAGIFPVNAPLAVAANGIIPLCGSCCDRDMPVNNGVITLEEAGTYLATVNAQVPAGTTLDTTVSLYANEARQYTAQMPLSGEGPVNAMSQAVFEVGDHAVVSLRSADAVSVTDASPQPLFTLSLVKID